MKDAILCYIFDRDRVLLQKKSRGFGQGKWNAPGGKIKFAETPYRAAVREVREETGLLVKELENVGLLNFFENDGGRFFSVHVFVAGSFEGRLRDGGEGKLEWFPKDKLPKDEMWEDDRFWLPYLLGKKRFRGDFLFTRGFKKMLKYRVEELK
jgi:8-oxo-dGTP diphosphatase